MLNSPKIFTKDKVKEEITNIKDDLNQEKTEIQELGEDVLDPDYATNKLIELEDRSRHNNIRIEESKKSSMKHWSHEKQNRRLSKKN